jgi:hypothetical protein
MEHVLYTCSCSRAGAWAHELRKWMGSLGGAVATLSIAAHREMSSAVTMLAQFMH